MARPKPLLRDLKAGKQKKKKQQQSLPDPETADEFLAAGVQLEEGGEKWRAGDPVKGMRFFMRAIETYSKGLERYPNNLDLAYNKARTQYEITQHPKLSSQLSASMIEALNVALDSHRLALVLGQDNADVIFNTAQVLTSLAEALTDDRRLMKVVRSNISDAGTGEDDARIGRALQCLFEALDLFQRCLSLQEFQVNESEEAMAEAKKLAEAAGVPQEGSNTRQPEEDEKAHDDAEEDSDTKNELWVSQSEVVTRDSLIDTTVAQFQTLSTLTSLLSGENANELAWVESYSKPIIDEKLPQYSQGASLEKVEEVGTAKATFIVSLADAFYRVGRLDFKTYRAELTNAFLPLGDISTNPEALVVQAEAFVTFSNAIGDNETPTKLQEDLEPTQPTIPGVERYKEAQSLRWQALSSALDCLTRATKLPNVETHRLPRIHIARGDAEMYRWRLGHPPFLHPMAVQHGAVLLNNAQTYYRGAAALARQQVMLGTTTALGAEAEGLSKEAVAAALGGNLLKLSDLLSKNKAEVMRRAEEMVEDDLATVDDVKKVWQQVDPQTPVMTVS